MAEITCPKLTINGVETDEYNGQKIKQIHYNGDTYVLSTTPAAISATVSGLGSSSPSSVTFSVDSGFTPANICTEVTLNGDTFIKIPTMYRKVVSTASSQITSFTIATAKVDSTYQPYPCFVDESENILPYVLIGKYWNTNSSSMVSTTSGTGVGMSIGNARTYARARGTGYQQWDWMFQKLWQDLIIVFKRTVNTNTGTAWTTDECGIYWGTSGTWVDGVVSNSASLVFSYKPTLYVDSATSLTTGYLRASYSLPQTNGVEISKLGYDSSNPFLNYPNSTTSNSSYNTYYCDAYFYKSDNKPVYSYVGSDGAHNGVFLFNCNAGWGGAVCVRLCYRPV